MSSFFSLILGIILLTKTVLLKNLTRCFCCTCYICWHVIEIETLNCTLYSHQCIESSGKFCFCLFIQHRLNISQYIVWFVISLKYSSADHLTFQTIVWHEEVLRALYLHFLFVAYFFLISILQF